MPFPIFQTHASVTCFSCLRVIGGKHTVSGYAPKQGAYVKECNCGMRTWYDINPNALTGAQVIALSWCELGLTEANRLVREITHEVLTTLVFRGFVISRPGAEKEWIITPSGRAALSDNRTSVQS